MVDLDELERFLCLDDLSCWRMNKPTLTAYEVLPAMIAEIRELRAENARLRIKWAELHNTCNVVGSPYDEALQAVDRLVCHVRTFARAALTGEPQ